MIKLLFKYIISFILLGLVAAVLLYMAASRLHAHGIAQTMKAMNYGVLQNLQMELQHYPQKNWSDLIKTLQPKGGNEVQLLSISQIKLSKEKFQDILAGEFVIIPGETSFYFGYGAQALNSYQRIGQSDYVLQMSDIPMVVIAQRVSAWTVQLISLNLKKRPTSQWPSALQSLQKIYGFPLTLSKFSSLTPSIKAEIEKYGIGLSDPKQTHGQIRYAYAPLFNNAILKIGPIAYPAYAQYLHYILIGIFIVLVVAFIILLVWILSRNLEKIYQITVQYSEGNFSSPPVVSKHSTLRTLYDNILKMGDKIQTLMTTQRNLTRFVAHECRTPVSTMLFAIEHLEQESLSENSKKQLSSIKEDLGELDSLISDFLNYARYSNEDLKLDKKLNDVNAWLKDCIEKYQLSPLPVKLISHAPSGKCFLFDPNLLRHVMTNLINNALKHAKSQVQVILEMENNHLLIHVDDDGSIIENAEKLNLFAPFVRLEESANYKGFGLGLNIAEMIVKRHQGDIQVADSPLGGTRFTVLLPCLK
ncbi:MAG: ATP-binding protein [Gammaproteobacteria bacterium]